MTPNVSKPSKFDTFAAIFLFIFLPGMGGVGAQNDSPENCPNYFFSVLVVYAFFSPAKEIWGDGPEIMFEIGGVDSVRGALGQMFMTSSDCFWGSHAEKKDRVLTKKGSQNSEPVLGTECYSLTQNYYLRNLL